MPPQCKIVSKNELPYEDAKILHASMMLPQHPPNSNYSNT